MISSEMVMRENGSPLYCSSHYTKYSGTGRGTHNDNHEYGYFVLRINTNRGLQINGILVHCRSNLYCLFLLAASSTSLGSRDLMTV